MKKRSIQQSIIPKEVYNYLSDIISDSGLLNITDELKDQKIHELFTELNTFVTRNIIKYLPKNKYQEFTWLISSGNTNEQKLKSFLQKHISYIQDVYIVAFAEFRSEQLKILKNRDIELMEYSKHDRFVEAIVLQLLQLIEEVKLAWRNEKVKLIEEDRRQNRTWISILRKSRPEDLVPEARNILTYKIAKKLDSDIDQASLVVDADDNHLLRSLDSDDLDFYLRLIMLTMESWLGPKNNVQDFATWEGYFYHSRCAEHHVKSEEWDDSENEYFEALQYIAHVQRSDQHIKNERWDKDDDKFDDEDYDYPEALQYIENDTRFTAGLVVILANLGLILHFQKRDYEAKEFFERVILIFERMQPNNILFNDAKKAYELAKTMV